MGKIRKILESELIGGTQKTDLYPITAFKAVYNSSNESLDEVLSKMSKDIQDSAKLSLYKQYFQVSNINRLIYGNNYSVSPADGYSIAYANVEDFSYVHISTKVTGNPPISYFNFVFYYTNKPQNDNAIKGSGETRYDAGEVSSTELILKVPDGAKCLAVCVEYSGKAGDILPEDKAVYLIGYNKDILAEDLNNILYTQDISNNFSVLPCSIIDSDGYAVQVQSSQNKIYTLKVSSGEEYSLSGALQSVPNVEVVSLAIIDSDFTSNIRPRICRKIESITSNKDINTTVTISDEEDGMYLMYSTNKPLVVTVNTTIRDDVLSEPDRVSGLKSYSDRKVTYHPKFINSPIFESIIDEMYVVGDTIPELYLYSLQASNGLINMRLILHTEKGNSNISLNNIKIGLNTFKSQGYTFYLVCKNPFASYTNTTFMFVYNTTIEQGAEKFSDNIGAIELCPCIYSYINQSQFTDDINFLQSKFPALKSSWSLIRNSLFDRDILVRYANSLALSKQLNQSNCKFFIKDTEVGKENTAIHDATIVKNGNTLYMISTANNTGVGADNPKGADTTARLDVVDYDNPINIESFTPAQKGSTIDGFTIQTGTGVPNLVLGGTNLYVLFTASDVASSTSIGYTGRWTLFYGIFNTQTKEFSSVGKCKFKYNDEIYDFDLPNIYDIISTPLDNTIERYLHQYFNNNSNIAEYNGEYYMSVCIAGFLKAPIIMKTSDFINWNFVTIPEFNCYFGYEAPLAVKDNYLYLATRGGNFNTLAKYNLTSNKWVDYVYLPSFADSRPCFFQDDADLYLWYTPSVGREQGIVTKVNTDNLSLSNAVYEIYSGSTYPSIVRDTNKWIVSRSMGGPGIGISEFTLPNVSANAVDTKMGELFGISYT